MFSGWYSSLPVSKMYLDIFSRCRYNGVCFQGGIAACLVYLDVFSSRYNGVCFQGGIAVCLVY